MKDKVVPIFDDRPDQNRKDFQQAGLDIIPVIDHSKAEEPTMPIFE